MGIYFNPPPVFTGGSQPYGQREGTPPTAQAGADDPVFGQAARLRREFWALRLSWESGPPIAQGRRSFVHAGAAPAGDNPPFRRAQQSQIHAAWQPQPWVFEQSLLVQGVPVNEPPYSDRTPLDALFAWNVGPHRIPAQRFLAQGAAPAVVNDPPFSSRSYWSTLRAWQITPPRRERTNAVVQETVQAVDNPPFSDRDYLHPTLALWQPEWRPIQGQRYAAQGVVEAAPDAPPTRRPVAPLALLAWQVEIPNFEPQRQLAIGYVPDEPPYTGRKPLNAVPHWVPPWPPVVYLPKQTVDNPPTGDPTPPGSRSTTVYGPGDVVVYGPYSVTFNA